MSLSLYDLINTKKESRDSFLSRCYFNYPKDIVFVYKSREFKELERTMSVENAIRFAYNLPEKTGSMR